MSERLRGLVMITRASLGCGFLLFSFLLMASLVTTYGQLFENPSRPLTFGYTLALLMGPLVFGWLAFRSYQVWRAGPPVFKLPAGDGQDDAPCCTGNSAKKEK